MSADTVTAPRSSLCTRCQSRPRRGPRQRWCRECRALMQRLARERTRKAKTARTSDELRNAPPAPTVYGGPANTAQRLTAASPLQSTVTKHP